MAQARNSRRRFKKLCERLRCNDPTVIRILDDSYPFPTGYGQRLGAALQHNTKVTDLTLHLSDLLSLRDVVAATTESVMLLMDFINSSPALQRVRLTHSAHCGPRDAMLASQILDAMIQNPGISALHWNVEQRSLELVTRFIEAKRTTLVSLELYFSCNRNEGRQPMEQRTLVANMESAARATARLTRLESLTLRVPQHVGLFLNPLVGHATLCHLHIVFAYDAYMSMLRSSTDMYLVSEILNNCMSLQHLRLANCHFSYERWGMLAIGLAAYKKTDASRRQQLNSLQLEECSFEANATLLLADKDSTKCCPWKGVHRAPDLPRAVGSLKLVNCRFSDRAFLPLDIPNMSGFHGSSGQLDDPSSPRYSARQRLRNSPATFFESPA
jgi:hypothetical protein